MLSKSGIAKNQVNTIWWLLELVIAVVAIAVIVFFLVDMDPGCSQYDENPQACIRERACKPVPDENSDGEIMCIRAMRAPNHRYNAAEDANCVCPSGWEIVLDKNDNHYGMCYREIDEEDYYYTCQYSIHVEQPDFV